MDGSAAGRRRIERVYGPDLMLNLCEHSVGEGFTHFFYGGNTGVADELKRTLENRFPGLQVVGTYCPLTRDEREDLRAMVDELRPDFFWVGLSTPKQDRFMAEYLPVLRGALNVFERAIFGSASKQLHRNRDCCLAADQ